VQSYNRNIGYFEAIYTCVNLTKNNQNQMNTTREQNLKEFNNTAGRLDGSLK
jgi:hypothetical protein